MSNEAEPCTPAVLRNAAKVVETNGNRIFSTWYDGNGKKELEYTFEKMWSEAGNVAHKLRNDWKMEKGQCAVLCFTPGLHFFSAFLGCLRAGVVAALVYPPDPSNLKQSLKKLNKIVENCSPVLCLVDSKVHFLRATCVYNPFSEFRNAWPDVQFEKTDDINSNDSFDEISLGESDLAFLQYTSGSTGDPKGVMVSFGALQANIQLIHNGFYQAFTEDQGIPSTLCGFSWLPQYHDLGLIYASIAPFLGSWRMHYMSPITFLQHPLLWLELISENKCHWGVAPDFAYRLIIRRMEEKKEKNLTILKSLDELDLSCVHNLQNGTEPIRADTKQKFEDIFKPYGLRDKWFQAGYGLAENVVGATWVHEYKTSESNPRLVAIGSRKTFEKSLTMKIVDPESNIELTKDKEIGELWIGGPSKAMGYFKQEELTKETFEAQLKGADKNSEKFLRTGDLMYFEDDYLYICGRMKDIIIARGRNIYPQDIEHAVQDARPDEVRPGCVAAFSSDESSNDGSVEVVFEIRSSKETSAEEVIQAVREAAYEAIGIYPVQVVAIREKTILKTTSGKIQRRATRDALKNKKLQVIKALTFEEVSENNATKPGPLEFGKRHFKHQRHYSLESFQYSRSSSFADSNDQLALSLSLSREERLKYLNRVLLDATRSILGCDIGENQPLMDAGFDSMKASQLYSGLQSQFENSFGIEIPQTILFDYPTISDISEYLESYISNDETALQQPINARTVDNTIERDEIAIVSMACRFPNDVTSPDEFWNMLVTKKNAVREIPKSRWDLEETYSPQDLLQEGKFYARHGAFIENVELFDNSFFGISDAEAQLMDPQQRILLEVGYEALYKAGYDKTNLVGSRIGVFIGCCNSEWAHSSMVSHGGPFAASGVSSSLLANRISYALGLRGPSESIDTACSSSLIAVHNAVRSLQSNDCDCALVASVNVLSAPEAFELLCSMNMLAPDGRCKVFDASADGYVRGEGCGAIVLKKVTTAESDKSNILAKIKGTSIGHNGRSASLTAPSSGAQKEIMQRALFDANADPSHVAYLEAHGTGTELGDPIEIAAIKGIYGKRNYSKPLVIGAVKTNIGHLEGAAGMAGLIKAVLVLRYSSVPPNIHLSRLNPRLDLKKFPVLFPDKLTPINLDKNSLVAVSSFGFGGANGHLLLAKGTNISLDSPTSEKKKSKVAFLFTGQGSQYAGMGLALYETYETFHSSIDKCAEIVSQFDDLLPCPLQDILFDENYSGMISDTVFCQLCIFALEYSLFKLLAEFDVRPDIVMGHSLGEVVAACAVGILSLDDGLRFTVMRATAMAETPKADGCMFAVRSSEESVMQILSDKKLRAEFETVSIAAINGPNSVTLSGSMNHVQKFLDHLGHPASVRLDVTHAFHSSLMNSAKSKVRAAAMTMKVHDRRVPLVTNMTGKVVTRKEFSSASHWSELITSPVLFSKGMQTLESMGCTHFVEIGPSPTLIKMAQKCVSETKRYHWTSFMQRIDPAPVDTFNAAIKNLKDDIKSLNTKVLSVFGTINLFKNRHYFPLTDRDLEDDATPKIRDIAVEDITAQMVVFPLTKNIRSHLKECRINEVSILPQGWLIFKAIESFRLTSSSASCFYVLEDITIEYPASSFSTKSVSSLLFTKDEDIAHFKVYVKPMSDVGHQFALGGSIYELKVPILDHVNIGTIQKNCTKEVDLVKLKEDANKCGLQLNNSFRFINKAFTGENEALVILDCSRLNIERHVGIILQAAMVSSLVLSENLLWCLPSNVYEISVFGQPVSPTLLCHIRLRTQTHLALICDVNLIDPTEKKVIIEVKDLTVVKKSYFSDRFKYDDPIYEIKWRKLAESDTQISIFREDSHEWLLLGFEHNTDDFSKFESIAHERYPRIHTFSNISHEDPADWLKKYFKMIQPTLVINYYDHSNTVFDVCRDMVRILRTISQFDTDNSETKIIYVTSGTVHQVESSPNPDLNQSWICGFLQSARLTYPSLRIVQIDIDAPRELMNTEESNRILGELIDKLPHICQHMKEFKTENTFCIRKNQILVPRMYHYSIPFDVRGPFFSALSADATYIITGGTGYLGLVVAEALVELGHAKNLILLSRSGKVSESNKEKLTRLQSRKDLNLSIIKCNVSHYYDVNGKLRSLLSKLPPVRGIIHAAGICPTSSVSDLEPNELLDTMKPKAGGVHVMNALSSDFQWELDFFVAFSSLSSLMGDKSRVAYAAANSAMDGVMRYRISRGLPALTIQWGPWAGAGMAESAALASGDIIGVKSISSEFGCAVIGKILHIKTGEIIVADYDWIAYNDAFATMTSCLQVIIDDQLCFTNDMCQAALNCPERFAVDGKDLTEGGIFDAIIQMIKEVVGHNVIGYSSDSTLQDFGVDSLGAVQLYALMKRSFGDALVPKTLLLDCKTPKSMAAAIYNQSLVELQREREVSKASLVSHTSRGIQQSNISSDAYLAGLKFATQTVDFSANGKTKAGPAEFSTVQSTDDREETKAGYDEAGGSPFYLLYHFFISALAYLYMGTVILLPGLAYFKFASFCAPMKNSVPTIIFVLAPIGWSIYLTLQLSLIAMSKWVLVGRIRSGTFFPRDSLQYTRWWVVQRLMGFAKMLILEELLHTRIMVWYYRLLGAKIGRGTLINTTSLGDPDMISIGTCAVINEQVMLQGSTLSANGVRFDEISIGNGAVLLPNTVVHSGGVVPDQVEVPPLSDVSSTSSLQHTQLCSNMRWSFASSMKKHAIDTIGLYVVSISLGLAAYVGMKALQHLSSWGNFTWGGIDGISAEVQAEEERLALFGFLSAFLLSGLFIPFVLVFAGMSPARSYLLLSSVHSDLQRCAAALAMLAASLVASYLSYILLSIAFKWLLVGKIRSSEAPVRFDSLRGIRKQIGDRIILSGMVRAVLLYNANLGNSLWLMALGARIGSRVSIFLNKNIYVDPDLLEIGDDVHVGFASSTYCSIWVSPTEVLLQSTVVGSQSMLGIGSVVLPGASVPCSCALGPNSCAGPDDHLEEGVIYLGAPRPLPVRRYTSPIRRLSLLERLLYFIAPIPMSFLTSFTVLAAAYYPLYLTTFLTRTRGSGYVVAASPFIFLFFGFTLCAVSATSKWASVGKQMKGQHLMWSWYHYKLVFAFQVYMKSMMLFGDLLRGGALYNAYLNANGARVSPSAIVTSIRVSDHDMLCVGDNAVIGEDAVPHPLYYSEGMISIDKVSIGDGAVMRDRSIVLGGGQLERNEELPVLKFKLKQSNE